MNDLLVDKADVTWLGTVLARERSVVRVEFDRDILADRAVLVVGTKTSAAVYYIDERFWQALKFRVEQHVLRWLDDAEPVERVGSSATVQVVG